MFTKIIEFHFLRGNHTNTDIPVFILDRSLYGVNKLNQDFKTNFLDMRNPGKR